MWALRTRAARAAALSGGAGGVMQAVMVRTLHPAGGGMARRDVGGGWEERGREGGKKVEEAKERSERGRERREREKEEIGERRREREERKRERATGALNARVRR